MKSDLGTSSDSTILNDIVEDTGRRGSKSSSGKNKRAKPAWIHLALTKRKVSQEGWIMDAIRGLFFLFHISKVKSDGLVTRLHVFTAGLLLAFAIMISTKQTVGNPIDCVHTRDIPVEVFNAYCWVHSTYFVTSAMLGIAGMNVAFPGVGPSMFYHPRNRQQPNERQRGSEGITRQVKYYQWVPFFLIFQTPAWKKRLWQDLRHEVVTGAATNTPQV